MLEFRIPLEDIVLDPFMGSGTTALASLKTNRRFIGIDKEPAYVTLANQNIKKRISQLRLPL